MSFWTYDALVAHHLQQVQEFGAITKVIEEIHHPGWRSPLDAHTLSALGSRPLVLNCHQCADSQNFLGKTLFLTAAHPQQRKQTKQTRKAHAGLVRAVVGNLRNLRSSLISRPFD